MDTRTAENYLHKKFDIKSNEYKHKKFGPCQQQKRKHIEIEETYQQNLNNAPIQTNPLNEQTIDNPVAKRKQSKSIFRPWEINTTKSYVTTNKTMPVQQQQTPHVWQYHSNMARQYPLKQRTTKEQERRNRNTLACLMNRRAQRAEEITMQQQYTQYREQYAYAMQAQLRSSLYLRYLQQLAETAKAGYTTQHIAGTQSRPHMPQQTQQLYAFGRV